jgi:hypothetical protein
MHLRPQQLHQMQEPAASSVQHSVWSCHDSWEMWGAWGVGCFDVGSYEVGCHGVGLSVTSNSKTCVQCGLRGKE